MLTPNEMYDFLLDYMCLEQEVLNIAVAIGGFNTGTFERILYYYTGWGDFDGYIEEINAGDF